MRGPAVAPETGRFEARRLIGQGGMGEVWLARDPVLGRDVALKLLRPGRGASPERFLREVKAQARVAHPNVCPVYEVGEVGGRAYLVMPFLDGRPLDEAAEKLDAREIAALAASVAEALHAAHREGLVHRDVKPTNVLVVRGETGRLEPFVLDFGLAADAEAPRLTADGTILGTPAYMSPEQASGAPGALDRRSDVYSLGATLWEVLARRPVRHGSTAAEVMLQLMTSDPPPLRKVAAEVPVDLETIVTKCLEREPSRRYETARALADDLRRFVDGEPVLARPVSRLGLLARRIRRNRTLASVAAGAVLAILLLAGLGVRERVLAARRQEAAELFGREAERIEWLLREERLLPLHDVRPATTRARERLAWLRALAARRGAEALGPAAYAEGRGLLALGELEAAQERLETARAAGVRSPDHSFALGRALAGLYQRANRAADALPSGGPREARLKEIAALYRDPALAALRESRGALGAAPEWVEGLVASCEERWPEALARAAEALRARPGLYEARQLAARVRFSEGREKERAGDWDGAKAAWAEAGKELAAALEVARSDSGLRADEVHRLVSLAAGATRRGEETDALFASAGEAVRLALAVDPEDPSVLDMASLVGWRGAEVLARRGDAEGARESYARAAAFAAEGVKRAPRSGPLWANLGVAEWGLAELEAERGGDPRPAFGRAAEALSRAADVEPWNPGARGDLSSVHLTRAQWEAAHGVDPAPALEEAIRQGEAAVRLAPERSALRSNLGNSWFALAERRALEGGDVSTPAGRALEAYHEALARNPKNGYAMNNAGEAHVLRARVAFEAGSADEGDLAKAVERFAGAISLNPRLVEARRGLAAARLLEARAARDASEPSAKALADAREALRGALEVNPRSAPTLTLVARARRLEVEWAVEDGRAAPAALAEGVDAATRARAADPSSADAAVELGRLLLARGDEAGSREALEEARRLNSRDPEPLVGLALLELRHAVAAGRSGPAPAEEARRAGLALVAKALALSPHHAEARRIRERLGGVTPPLTGASPAPSPRP